MAAQALYAELARQLNAIGILRRGLLRALPTDCPSGPAATLSLLHRHGEMRVGRLGELLAIDMSVTSRHVAHTVDRGWVERVRDPADRRSRILRITPAGTAKLTELHDRTAEMFSHRLDGWSNGEVEELIAMLSRLRDSFGADCRVPPPARAATAAPAVRPEPAVPPAPADPSAPPGLPHAPA
ncbi:MarR family winged helix-turn-helix transcriptional regulator [Streptomyces sp. NPDC020412]|uniref:MarR family winged helix-turn-helix transcriptional regulator n=1 Tax=Streptomyces sp. NPDC020412 TaxID=3365073 RepID=UPI00378F0F15